jgi:hypothetical protein
MTTSAIVIDQAQRSYRGLSGETWLISATVTPPSVAAETTGNDTITVSGVRLGDMQVAWAPGVAIPDNLVVQVAISANDTLQIKYTNNNAAGGAAIQPAASTWYFWIFRPKNSTLPS